MLQSSLHRKKNFPFWPDYFSCLWRQPIAYAERNLSTEAVLNKFEYEQQENLYNASGQTSLLKVMVTQAIN